MCPRLLVLDVNRGRIGTGMPVQIRLFCSLYVEDICPRAVISLDPFEAGRFAVVTKVQVDGIPSK